MYSKEEIELMHYGTKRHSGRWPWGSGKEPFQRSGDFLSRVDELRKAGVTYTDEKDGKTYTGDTAVAKTLGMTTGQFRVQVGLAKQERHAERVKTAQTLEARGLSRSEIAKQMGLPGESSVRALLTSKEDSKMEAAKNLANFLKDQVDSRGMIDVGTGAELSLGKISREKFNQALYILETQGYNTFTGGIPQVTNKGQQTIQKVLCPPDTPYKVTADGHKVSAAIYDFDKIHSLADYESHDGGETFDKKFVYPKSFDSKRLQIRYAEEGGIDKDGLVEIRRGVEDVSLGKSTYAQVRVLVDGTHYIKGMAVYGDDKDFPDGVDIIFNTNKSVGTPMKKVLKSIKSDPENPFGSLIKDDIVDPDHPEVKSGGQRYYYDKNGKKQLSVINKRAEEGDWDEWSNELSSQFLAKQPEKLIKQQLNLSASRREDEFDQICSLTNPTVKKNLLQSFSDDCDSAAVHLKAASLPGQRYQVILPLTTLGDNEAYAPNFKPGATLALIRYPHGGTFEIPIVKVNNKNAEGQKIMGNSPMDAIGINAKVAGRLSGADFDGDTVMAIPLSSKTKITSVDPAKDPHLKDLIGFEPKMSYGPDSSDPVKVIDKNGNVWTGKDAIGKEGKEFYTHNGKEFSKMANTQNEMGRISNLITDMTLQGATSDELVRAVKHSMVVIDAEKHHLDYKQSYIDNNIAALKSRYQGTTDADGKYHEGAATLLSRSKSEYDVPKTKGSPKINQKGKDWYDPTRPEGALIYNHVNETYVGNDGKTHRRMQKSTKMAETDDAYTLVSDARTTQEMLYADYANRMKALGNRARMEYVRTPSLEYKPAARETYAKEVESLDSSLRLAKMNQPKERIAQRMANSIVKAKKEANPDMTKAEIKKANQQALSQSRAKVGAKRIPVTISDKEWEAIQAGAISDHKLASILKYANPDRVRELAMPRQRKELSAARINRIQSALASGYTTSEIAEQLGISKSQVLAVVKETKGADN